MTVMSSSVIYLSVHSMSGSRLAAYLRLQPQHTGLWKGAAPCDITSRAASTKTRGRQRFHGNCWQPQPKWYRANDMTEMCASGVNNTNNRRTSSISAPQPPSRSVCRAHKAISAALISCQMTYLLLITFSRLAAAPR